MTHGGIYIFAEYKDLVTTLQFIAEPTVLMTISLLAATYLLGIKLGKSIKEIMSIYEDAIKDIFLIVLIIGCSGALKGILVESGAGEQIGDFFKNVHIHPLILAWLIAATIRVSLGSATVAGLTTASIIAPIMGQLHVDPSLMVLSIGAGSIMFSHVNDSGFWMYKEYFKLSIKETFLTWTLMETVLSITGFIFVMLLSYILPLL
jgi:Gnt-I system high-affinity gluconate transporter